MEDKIRELLNKLKCLSDLDLLSCLTSLYEDGYTDGYNGNDNEKGFEFSLHNIEKVVGIAK